MYNIHTNMKKQTKQNKKNAYRKKKKSPKAAFSEPTDLTEHFKCLITSMVCLEGLSGESLFSLKGNESMTETHKTASEQIKRGLEKDPKRR